MSTSRATSRRRSRSSSAALAAAAVLLAGCGGGGSAARERYEQAMQRSLSVIVATARPSPAVQAALRQEAARVAAIAPPHDVAAEHARLVTGLRAAARGRDEAGMIESTLRAIERHGYQVVATFSDAAD